MASRMLGRCPICQQKMDVVRLHCPTCDTSIEGRFETCKFCQLSVEQKAFIEVFVKSRGNIKEVEREMGISYPTVRSRLDAVIEALGYRVEPSENDSLNRRKKILEAVDQGAMTAEEAARLLKQLGSLT
ncbi:MAG: DUF2089 family protein [Bacillota bacterium]